MAELPAHPIFWSDFFADTEHMSEGAAKAYLFIIGHSWIRGGKIKNEDRLIARLCRLSLRRWLALKDEVMEMLEVDDEGFVYQRRVQKDYVNVRRRAIVNSENGRKGGKAKAAKKSNKNNESDVAIARNSPRVRQSETLASKTITKTKGLGLDRKRRSLSPGGPDPPSTQPDPQKFAMTADWVVPNGLHDELTAEHVPKLGVEPFWRQIKRFAEHHAERGTVDTAVGFAQRLRGWLERADANHQVKSATAGIGNVNGSASCGNGQDPPRRRGTGGLPKFVNRILALCCAEKDKTKGINELTEEETEEIKLQAFGLYDGENVILGVSWGPNLTADGVFALLPDFDGFRQTEAG